MDLKAIIILILSVALAGVLGFMYAKRGNNGMFKRKMKTITPKAKANAKGEPAVMLQPKPNTVKGEANAKGEPAEVQSMVAQYMIENGL